MGIESYPSPDIEAFDAEATAEFGVDDASVVEGLGGEVVGWLCGRIAESRGVESTEVTDAELCRLYVHGGRLEWDPAIAQLVALYLKHRGFLCTP